MKQHHRHTLEDSLTPDEPILDISSLIDVCFLLLIYFIVTTTIQPVEQDLNTTVPVPGEALVSLPPMLIELRQDGAVVVNPGDAAEVYDSDVQSRDLPHLTERLSSMGGLGRGGVPSVLLKINDEVQQQRYIDVINCLAGAGISDIAIVD